jgi:nickel/cobalt transporter (NicO) family protein
MSAVSSLDASPLDAAMLEQTWHWIGQAQGGLMHALAEAMRTGSATTLLLAFALGALNAMTPGHGKTALTAYMLGRQTSANRGVRIALSAAALHIFSGLVVFLALRYLVKQSPLGTGRSPLPLAIVGAGFIVLAGVMMIWRAVRRDTHTHDDAHSLTFGIGLLPCPVTVSVLSFAWLQSSVLMMTATIFSLALGIGSTIVTVALAANATQRLLGQEACGASAKINRSIPVLQTFFGIVLVMVGVRMLLVPTA